ncbi:MAG: MBOAT family protein, partial [Lachnospiraceae bacterium]|nr:MBOAT family protein [Lachnospiraceae bacterium]
MTFSSELFLFALLPILLASMLLNQNQRNTQQVMILLANICFGLWSGFGGLVLILAMTGGTFLLVRFWILPGERGRLALTITLLCLPLLFFKYTAFLIGNVNALFRISLSVPDLMLPLGISFYTFQAISLVVDVYRGEVCEVRFREVLLYLTFFPTVTSGPILRFTPFREGLASPVRYRDWNGALFRFVLGLSKKVLIADRLALLADYYFDGIAAGGSYSAAGLWLGSIAYSLQLYFDFSGYSDMAIGIG